MSGYGGNPGNNFGRGQGRVYRGGGPYHGGGPNQRVGPYPGGPSHGGRDWTSGERGGTSRGRGRGSRGNDRGRVNTGKAQHKDHAIDIPTDQDGTKRNLRPGEQALSIITNYVRIKSVPDELFVYSITNQYFPDSNDLSITRSLNRRTELEKIFGKVREDIAFNNELANMKWATDYRTFYSSQKLVENPKNQTGGVTGRRITLAQYEAEGGLHIASLIVTFTFEKHLTGLRQAFQNTNVQQLTERIEALNTFITHPLRESNTPHTFQDEQYTLTPLGPNQFFINEKYDQMTALRGVRGYFTSIRPGETSLLLNLNITTTAVFERVKVSDFVNQMTVDTTEVAKDVQRQGAERMLRGVRLHVTFDRPKDPNRQVNTEQGRNEIFKDLSLGKLKEVPYSANKSVWQHFRNDLNQRNLVEDDYCVNVGTPIRNPNQQNPPGVSWIPAQLLDIIPYQTVKTQLYPSHLAELIEFACRTPAENARLIASEGLGVLQVSTQTPLEIMGFSTQKSLIQLPAKILVTPLLSYMSKPTIKAGEVVPTSAVVHGNAVHASWNLKDVAFSKPGTIPALNVFVFNGTRCHPKSKRGWDQEWNKETSQDEVRKNLRTVLTTYGMQVPANQGATKNAAESELEDFLKEREGVTLIILENENADTYARIRKLSDLKLGKHTVCAVGSKIAHYPDANQYQDRGYQVQHLTNIALKVNLKSGGCNHTLISSTLSDLLNRKQKDTIIFGADVTHPPAGQPIGYPSIACVVSSIDEEFQSYRGSMRLQAGRQEIIADMESMVRERLDAWITKHNRLPTQLIFYRDGIGESMFDACKTEEITPLLNLLATLRKIHNKPDLMQGLTFIVAGKRHHTRFYPTNDAPKTKTGNVTPGLFVDQVITPKGSYNFYLQSHAALHGTARSAHYTVLRDDLKLADADERLANLTHQLCYSYARATKGVSYAAPAYLADRLCERGRAYLRGWDPGQAYKLPRTQTNGSAWTKDAIMQWKAQKADELSRNRRVWPEDGAAANATGARQRMNPWHKNLDDSMFWM